jgi:hypothetical protein
MESNNSFNYNKYKYIFNKYIYMYKKIAINIFEAFAFILPAIPNSFNVRIIISSIYFIGHYYKIQNTYKKLKNNFIKS